MDDKPTLLFDGHCNLCAGLVRFIQWGVPNEELSFVPARSSSARTLIESHNLHGNAFATIVLIDADGIYRQSDAVLHSLRRLPYPWRLGALMRVVPRSIRDSLYKIAAANRYRWFGKRSSCFVVTPQREN